MAGIETKVNSFLKTVGEMAERNSRLEEDLLRCQDEIVALKKSNFQSNRKIQSIEETQESMTSVATRLEVEMESSTSMRQNMASIKRDVQYIQEDIKDIKKDIQRIDSSIDPEKTKKLSQKVVSVDRKVNTLNEKVTKGTQRLDITDLKLDRIHRVFNKAYVSGQSRQDVGEEVQGLRQDMSQLTTSVQHQQQQQLQLQNQQQQLQKQQKLQQQQLQLQPQLQQQATPLPTPQPSASMPPKKPASASTPLTKQQLKDIKTKAEFHVYSPSVPRLQTGSVERIVGYRQAQTDSLFMDKESGVYKTPTRGRYEFDGWMGQSGHGNVELYVCEDGKGRLELLYTTERGDVFDGRIVSWDCDEGVSVWVECVRIEGNAEVAGCEFHGWLLR